MGVQRNEIVHRLQLAFDGDGLVDLLVQVLHHLVGVVVLLVLLERHHTVLLIDGRKDLVILDHAEEGGLHLAIRQLRGLRDVMDGEREVGLGVALDVGVEKGLEDLLDEAEVALLLEDLRVGGEALLDVLGGVREVGCGEFLIRRGRVFDVAVDDGGRVLRDGGNLVLRL